MSNNIWTITQLVNYLKTRLSSDPVLFNVSVKGEIGNFTNHFSGHWYFSLKDDYTLINCAMFKGYNRMLDFVPKNGDSVIVSGNINIFEKSGQLQIVVTSMKPDGEGDFYAQFEKTKKKLEPLGYFDEKRKKPIPQYPKQISVITGANTAALQDIRITVSKRWPVKLIEVYAIVQGKEAIEDITKALKTADTQNSDVIILARGGGSVDDLWCFNDEKIATAIYNCKTPVITGIGHEIDFTIADLVADKRAATPTAAAVAATPDLFEVKSTVDNYRKVIVSAMQHQLDNSNQYLDYYVERLGNYHKTIDSLQVKVSSVQDILLLGLDRNIQNARQKLAYLNNNLADKARTAMERKAFSFTRTAELLDSLSPLKTLSRGYIVSRQDGNIIKSVKEINKTKPIKLTYADGSIETIVKEDEIND